MLMEFCLTPAGLMCNYNNVSHLSVHSLEVTLESHGALDTTINVETSLTGDSLLSPISASLSTLRGWVSIN